jgi:hypothetical protein
MNTQAFSWNKVLLWTPRILALLFSIFIGLFATDVFAEEPNFFMALLGFLIQTIPALLLIGATAVAWAWPKYGGIIFITLAVISVFVFRLSGVGIAIISGPSFFIGLIFLASYYTSCNYTPDRKYGKNKKSA